MGLTKHRFRGKTLAGMLACSALIASTADAQHHRGHRESRRSHAHHVDAHSVGTIVINGNRFCLEGRRSITYEICAAFCKAGYNAKVEGGCVVVRYRGCEPRVTLVGCDYGLDKTRSYGCLTLHPYLLRERCAPPAPKYERPVYRRSLYDRYYTPRYWPKHRRSRCSIGGITIRF